jgi:hypothetical protein
MFKYIYEFRVLFVSSLNEPLRNSVYIATNNWMTFNNWTRNVAMWLYLNPVYNLTVFLQVLKITQKILR